MVKDNDFGGSAWSGGNVEIPRDRYDRPLVMRPDDSGKRTAYRRVTTFIGVLEDEYKLKEWERRVTAFGMGQRDDLVLAAAALSMEPEDKKSLQKVADDAKEHGLASRKANIGTALHKLTERLDRGETLGRVPAPYGDDLKAYEATCKQFRLHHHVIESFRVDDNWRVAGTTDRITRVDSYDGEYVISDVKTGNLDFGKLKMAMQLAMYRHCIPYDIPTDTRGEDTVPISRKRGLIIHLPAGEGRCELHWVDLEVGHRACLVAYKVWEQRKIAADKIMWPVKDQLEFPITTPGLDLVDRVQAMRTLDELKELYFEAKVNNLDSLEFVGAVKSRKAQLLSGVS